MNYKEHLNKLRDLYIKATPRQRIRVAEDRIKYPSCGPNRLIQTVSAVEGLARTIAIYQRSKTKNDLKKEYKNLKLLGPVKLIEDHICPKIKKTPTTLLGKDTWDKFKYANKYRNLLIHECTFLRQDVSSKMIKVAENTFEKLRELVK